MQRGLIALVIIAVLAGGAILLGRGVEVGVFNDASHGASGQPKPTPPAPALLPVKIMLECVDPVTFSDKTKDGYLLMEKKELYQGHKIRIIKVTAEWPKDLKDTFAGESGKPPADDLPGKAIYNFDVPRDDTYYINLRAQWVDTCGDSVWVKIDDSEYITLTDQGGYITKTSYSMAWHQLQQSGTLKGFELKQGRHKLTMSVRQNGPSLHRWVITTDASPLPSTAEE